MGQFAIKEQHASIETLSQLVSAMENNQIRVGMCSFNNALYSYLLFAPNVTDPNILRMRKVSEIQNELYSTRVVARRTTFCTLL